jgi:Tol biopolymer transport system component
VSRLGDDRSFVAAAFNRRACVSHLLKFTIDPAGRPSALTRLAAPVRGQIEELTTSADGTTLAVKVSGCAPGGPQTAVTDLATGQTTRWDTPARAFDASLSLTADGSVLGFVLNPDVNDPNATDQAWIKPTDAPAGPLLSHARQVPGLGASAERTVLSPDGKQLWIEAQKTPNSTSPVTLSLVTTRTGALVKKITRLSRGGRDLTFVGLALDNAGQHMLAYGGHPGPGHADAEEIDLRSGQTLTLPITNPVIEGALTTFAW